MKKLLTIIVVISCYCISATGQESAHVFLNKSGVNILPEKGDLSIGIDAVPFLNLLNDKGDSPGFNFVQGIPTISIKYFNTDRSAIRLNVSINHTSLKDGDDKFNQFVKDISTDIGLEAGYEKRLGKSRVQGFYGLEGGISTGKEKNSDNTNFVFTEDSYFAVTLDGFIGVEYFVAPKLSLGGQFSWGPTYILMHDSKNSTKTTVFNMSAQNMGAALILSFAF